MPCPEMGKPISRLTTFKSRPRDLSSKIVAGARKMFVRIGLSKIERDYKRYLGSLVPYGGSTWWTLSRKVCEYVQDFVDKNPVIVDFYKNTICPDESFFQTILGNSPYQKSLERSLTYTDWSGGAPSPAIISEKHLSLFESSSSVIVSDGYGSGEALFARKFSDQSYEIVEKIDSMIKKREYIA